MRERTPGMRSVPAPPLLYGSARRTDSSPRKRSSDAPRTGSVTMSAKKSSAFAEIARSIAAERSAACWWKTAMFDSSICAIMNLLPASLYVFASLAIAWSAVMLASDYGPPTLYSGYAFTDRDAGPVLEADGSVADASCAADARPDP